MNIYYVYAYLRQRTSVNGEAGSPYYIGKGKKNRIYESHKECSGKLPKDRRFALKIFENLSNADASALEVLLIKIFGRLDLKTGCLRNKTNGGDGSTGLKVSEETRRKQSIAKIGSKWNVTRRQKSSMRIRGSGNPFYGKKHSQESKAKISKNNGKGQAKVSPEQVKEIRRLYKETDMTQEQIGKLFGLASSTTNQIITKRWWKDID